jgi:hypothetical protein
MSQERHPTLPKMEDLVVGRVYKLKLRDSSYGIWDGESGFIGIRLKFHSRFLDTELHWDCPDYGTVEDAVDTGIDAPKAVLTDAKALFAFLDRDFEARRGGGGDVKRYSLGPCTYVRTIKGKGRGVFAAEDIPTGRLVLVNDVALIEPDALKKTSKFNDYPMAWTHTHDCIALGQINLLNHADQSNCRIERFRDRVMECWTKKPVKKDEELTIQYCCAIWFKVQ